MKAKPIQCPDCGRPAGGRFCSHCGTFVAPNCPACGIEVKPGMRACSGCGASLTARVPKKSAVQTIVPWAALGVATLALAIAIVSLVKQADRVPAVAAPPVSALFDAAPAASGAPVDISAMAPREAADRLFNHVMEAAESGNKTEAMQFVPMALAAYGRVGTLDDDAHYHLGLIHLTAGDIKSARAELDKIRRSAPKHLLGIMLAHDIAERSGDKAGVAKAYRAFLAAFDAEAATGKPEYQHHWANIERFRAAAQASVTAKK